jgi:hypothetical protein
MEHQQNTTNVAPKLYKFSKDGVSFMAKGPLDFIVQMRERAFHPGKNVEDYMFEFSERALFSLHVVVRFDTPQNFVADLKKHGIIDVFLVN